MPGLHGMENRDKQIRLNHGRWLPQHYPAQATEVACSEGPNDLSRSLVARQATDGMRSRGSGSQRTLCWRKADSNLYGAFPVKPSFLVVVGSLFGAGKPFFVPSPAIRFAERAEGVQGTETVAKLGGLPASAACVSQRLEA
jgi:hypothetical protein